MRHAQRLKRVFGIKVETCQACGGALKIIACIERSSGRREGPHPPRQCRFSRTLPQPAAMRCADQPSIKAFTCNAALRFLL